MESAVVTLWVKRTTHNPVSEVRPKGSCLLQIVGDISKIFRAIKKVVVWILFKNADSLLAMTRNFLTLTLSLKSKLLYFNAVTLKKPQLLHHIL